MSKAIPIDDMEEEDISCPICTDELDITDIHFKPCACGYQVEIFFFPITNIMWNLSQEKWYLPIYQIIICIVCRCVGFVGII